MGVVGPDWSGEVVISENYWLVCSSLHYSCPRRKPKSDINDDANADLVTAHTDMSAIAIAASAIKLSRLASEGKGLIEGCG